VKQFFIAGTALLALTACSASDTESVGVGADATPAEIGAAFLKKNAKKSGVKTSESGLQYKVVQKGLENGASAAPGQGIAAHYHGYFIDGEVFDSSYTRGQPLTGPSNAFIIFRAAQRSCLTCNSWPLLDKARLTKFTNARQIKFSADLRRITYNRLSQK